MVDFNAIRDIFTSDVTVGKTGKGKGKKRDREDSDDQPPETVKKIRKGPRKNDFADEDSETKGGSFKYKADSTAKYLFDSIHGSQWTQSKVHQKGPEKGVSHLLFAPIPRSRSYHKSTNDAIS